MSENRGNQNRGKELFETAKRIAAYVIPIMKWMESQIPFLSEKIKSLDNFRIDRMIDVRYLRESYRKKNNTQIIIANIGSLLDAMPNGGSMYFDESTLHRINTLQEEYILIEYNEITNSVIQADYIREDKIALNIMNALQLNDGIIIIEGE